MDWIMTTGVAQTIGVAVAVLLAIALTAVCAFALLQYRRDVRLRAADILLRMEAEYRTILPTCLDVESPSRYQTVVAPVLRNALSGGATGAEDAKILARLERCLRFFFLCTVLDSDLHVGENAIAGAYYHYFGVLANPGPRQELQLYIKKYYPRLDKWMVINYKRSLAYPVDSVTPNSPRRPGEPPPT